VEIPRENACRISYTLKITSPPQAARSVPVTAVFIVEISPIFGSLLFLCWRPIHGGGVPGHKIQLVSTWMRWRTFENFVLPPNAGANREWLCSALAEAGCRIWNIDGHNDGDTPENKNTIPVTMMLQARNR
jgi:hypothetical protein